MSEQPDAPFSQDAQTVVDAVANEHAHFAVSVCQAFNYTESLFQDALASMEAIVEGKARVILRDDHLSIFPTPLLSVGLSVLPMYSREILLDTMHGFPLDWAYTRGLDLGVAYVTRHCRDVLRRAICARMCELLMDRCCSEDSRAFGHALCVTFLGSVHCRSIDFEGYEELFSRFQSREVCDLVIAGSEDLQKMMNLRHKMHAGSQVLIVDEDKSLKVVATPESATLL
jgi:hypothetical protein